MHKIFAARTTAPILVPILALLSGCVGESADELKTIFDAGVAAYDAGDYPRAYKIWKGIDDVDLAAMRNVAMMLRQGQGVAKDPKAAEDLYETAAAAGLPTAQADLADMLIKGEAGPPDPKAALPLLEAAAAAHHPLAQYELAQIYEAGTLVPKNIETAKGLYRDAAAHGMKEAQDRLDQLAIQPAPNVAASETAPGLRP
ncbi:MAG TPA: tetratricopeptide repeat protein [Rhizomicrobium sp.]|nr:tetratricopeptide repeat protein [Rhizomicrobium sp.]